MLEELRMIQDVIRRLSSQSFLVKGWTVTLVLGSLLLEGGELGPLFAIVPVLAFWWLDAHFLRSEHRFRRMHQWVARHRADSEESLLDLDPSRFDGEVGSPWRLMASSTLLCFYGMMLALVGIVALGRGVSAILTGGS